MVVVFSTFLHTPPTHDRHETHTRTDFARGRALSRKGGEGLAGKRNPRKLKLYFRFYYYSDMKSERGDSAGANYKFFSTCGPGFAHFFTIFNAKLERGSR